MFSKYQKLRRQLTGVISLVVMTTTREVQTASPIKTNYQYQTCHLGYKQCINTKQHAKVCRGLAFMVDFVKIRLLLIKTILCCRLLGKQLLRMRCSCSKTRSGTEFSANPIFKQTTFKPKPRFPRNTPVIDGGRVQVLQVQEGVQIEQAWIDELLFWTFSSLMQMNPRTFSKTNKCLRTSLLEKSI